MILSEVGVTVFGETPRLVGSDPCDETNRPVEPPLFKVGLFLSADRRECWLLDACDFERFDTR